jgi:hypothetical protein
MNKIQIKTQSDIPANWEINKAKKKTTVRIRESIVPESFKVSWQDSELVSDPNVDLIVIQLNNKEYPCKRDIFFETYENVSNGEYRKNELSTLIQIPENYEVEILTLEGTLNAVSYPDFIVVGKRGELYANKKEWVENNLQFIKD